jgi:PAS domain S-box-containing protein
LTALQTTHDRLRATLGALAAGAPLDDTLRAIAADVVARLGASACKVWLVKQGDLCDACAAAEICHDRSMCLHLKAATDGSGDAPRVPLVVFRDRVAARGGSARLEEHGIAPKLLFAPEAVAHAAGGAIAAVPLKGPAGILGLLAVLRETPVAPAELDALTALGDLAVVAIRIADLTSRHQRAAMQLDEVAETRGEVEGLLHAILYGSTEYDVIAEDLEGNITVFSEGASTTYGYAPEDVIGRAKADILFAPEEIESGKIVEILNEAMTTGRCEAVVTRIRKNGERFPARATFTVRRDVDGDPSGFVIVERDLSGERNSARLGETAALRAAELQDHLQALKAAHARLEEDAAGLALKNEELRREVDRARDVDDLNAIRVDLIKDLRRKVDALAAERDRLAARAAELERARPSAAAAHPYDVLARDLGTSVDAILGLTSVVVDGRSAFTVTIPRGEPGGEGGG